MDMSKRNGLDKYLKNPRTILMYMSRLKAFDTALYNYLCFARILIRATHYV